MFEAPAEGFSPRFSASPAGFAPWGADAADAPPSPLPEQSDPAQAGYAQGLADGIAHAAGMNDAANRLAAALDGLRPVPEGEVVAAIMAAMHVALAELIGTAPVDAELLGRRCAALAQWASGAGGEAVLRLHPDDLALLPDPQPDDWPRIADPHLPRGEVRLEQGAGTLAAGPRTALDALARTWGITL